MAGPTESTGGQRHRLFWPVLAVALILLGWALHATAAFTIPIAFAFFVAIAIAPLDYWVRSRMPERARWAGHAVSMLVLIVILGLFFAGIGFAARQVVEKFPGMIGGTGRVAEQTAASDEGQDLLDLAPAGNESAMAADGQESPGPAGDAAGDQTQARQQNGGLLARIVGDRSIPDLLIARAATYADTVLRQTVSFILSLVLVLFLALFMLIEGPTWEGKARAVLSRQKHDEWLHAIGRTAAGVRWFVVVRAALGLVTGLLYVAWLAIMGVDLLFVWGLITFLLNFMPTIGSIISGVLATAYAFYQLSPWQAVIVGFGLFVIEQIMGNYVDPRFLGRQLALSGLMVLVWLLIWGWIWGIAGAFLATPILILVLMVAAHIPALRPLAVLLSEKGEESVEKIDSAH